MCFVKKNSLLLLLALKHLQASLFGWVSQKQAKFLNGHKISTDKSNVLFLAKVCDEKLPEHSGNPPGLGNISLYTPPLVTIHLQY